MRTPRGPTMVSQRSQNGFRMVPQGSISGILGPLGPPRGPSGVFILVFHFLLLPLDKISAKTMENLLLELIGWEQNGKKFIILVLRGLCSRLSFSTTLSAFDQCNNNENVFLSEMDNGKIKKIQDFGRFWLGARGP